MLINSDAIMCSMLKIKIVVCLYKFEISVPRTYLPTSTYSMFFFLLAIWIIFFNNIFVTFLLVSDEFSAVSVIRKKKSEAFFAEWPFVCPARKSRENIDYSYLIGIVGVSRGRSHKMGIKLTHESSNNLCTRITAHASSDQLYWMAPTPPPSK